MAASLLIGVGHIYTQLGPLRFNRHLLLLGPFHQETDKQELFYLLCVYTFQIVTLLCYGRSQSFHLPNQLDTVDSPIVVAFLCSQRWLWLLSEMQSIPLFWTPCPVLSPTFSQKREGQHMGENGGRFKTWLHRGISNSPLLTFIDLSLGRVDHQCPVSHPQPSGSTFTSHR